MTTKREMEESDSVLDFIEGDPLDFWEKKQKELVTSVVDYNLNTLSQLVKDGTIDLSPKYQRRFRWDSQRQSKLIESFLMNVPVPPVFLNEDIYGKYSVIDGKQRLIAITDFFSGKLELKGLEIFSDINNMTIDLLPKRLQSIIKTRPTLRAIIILHQSDVDVKFEVFKRLNTGGVNLNPQEIRNSTYPGLLNDLILELSENKLFHQLLGIKNKNKSVLYQEMRDAEFVLRYFTFKDVWLNFKGSMKRLMDKYMEEHQYASPENIAELRADFFNTIDVVKNAFGDFAFQRWIPEKQAWRGQILASLYDAEMFAARGLAPAAVAQKQERIVMGLKEAFLDEEFRKSISAATNNIGNFRTRVSKLTSMLQQSITE
ncbi:MAG: DUF262 domain-containing protein [Syntrophorhabdaceae bacterium]|jgi:hypothetical protein|nr:DUF262 domain-containing protein [Syntrophorhabdaceae bacterium]MDD5242831.1 DUF262 domain-containing protein [Syntrophorhabdaceae bacterium]